MWMKFNGVPYISEEVFAQMATLAYWVIKQTTAKGMLSPAIWFTHGNIMDILSHVQVTNWSVVVTSAVWIEDLVFSIVTARFAEMKSQGPKWVQVAA
jgi:hypothetical protein